MLKKINTLIFIFLLSTVSAFSAGSAGDTDGGGDSRDSKYKEGHKLVLSGKYLEKKSDKFKKKGNVEKAEKNLVKAKKNMKKPSKNC